MLRSTYSLASETRPDKSQLGVVSLENTISLTRTPVGALSHVVDPKTNADQHHDADCKSIGSVAQDVPSNLAADDDCSFEDVGCCAHALSVVPNLILHKRLVLTLILGYTSTMQITEGTQVSFIITADDKVHEGTVIYVGVLGIGIEEDNFIFTVTQDNILSVH